MEKINIADLLRDCPKGMELDCVSYDNVSFDKISDDKIAIYPIFCYITDKEGNRSSISFTENGCESKRYGAKCVIFPKGKTTWEGFVPPVEFKDGDVIITSLGNIAIISNKINNEIYNTYCELFEYGTFTINDTRVCPERSATEEEKAKLFQAIKDNDYKWNAETKTLEKLPKFKVGNRIRKKNNNSRVYTINGVYSSMYSVEGRDFWILIEEQDEWELFSDKFDINTLVPFEDKVLVRNDESQRWLPAFWGYKVVDGFITTFGWCKYSIPYKGNENLFKTNNDCDDFYKTWEE